MHTSTQGGFHLWLRLTRALDESQRHLVQRWLIPRLDADLGSGKHLGRLGGMKNFKRGGVWVNVLRRPSPHARVWDPTPALQSTTHGKRPAATRAYRHAHAASTAPHPPATGDGSAAHSKPASTPRSSTNECSRMPAAPRTPCRALRQPYDRARHPTYLHAPMICNTCVLYHKPLIHKDIMLIKSITAYLKPTR